MAMISLFSASRLKTIISLAAIVALIEACFTLWQQYARLAAGSDILMFDDEALMYTALLVPLIVFIISRFTRNMLSLYFGAAIAIIAGMYILTVILAYLKYYSVVY